MNAPTNEDVGKCSELVKCSGCNVYVDKDACIEYKGERYCCTECKSKKS